MTKIPERKSILININSSWKKLIFNLYGLLKIKHVPKDKILQIYIQNVTQPIFNCNQIMPFKSLHLMAVAGSVVLKSVRESSGMGDHLK